MSAPDPTENGSRPLRIALVVERFAPDGGGVERVAWEVAHALARAGDDEVHVVAREAEPAGDITLHRVTIDSTAKALRLLEFSRAARRVTEASGFDVVHGFARVHAQDIFHAGLGCHADYMAVMHDAMGRTLRRFTPRHMVQLQLEAQIARDPDIRIQCVSDSVARAFQRHYGVPDDRLVRIPNGVDLDRFVAGRGREGPTSLRAELAPGADAVWLFVGSGFRRKGLETALEALAGSRIPKSVLWVAGRDRADAWRRRAARLGITDRVRFLGERDDVDQLLAASDGLLLPTRYEPGGLSVLEAAASGVPVVTSAACGHAELIDDGAIVVHDAEDAPEFSAALDRLADGALRNQLGTAGRRSAEALGWASITQRLRAEYGRIAASKGRVV